jgi:hypothetical protein
MFIPHREHTYGQSRSDTGIVLLFYIQIVFVSHREYRPVRPFTEIALFYFLTFRFCASLTEGRAINTNIVLIS